MELNKNNVFPQYKIFLKKIYSYKEGILSFNLTDDFFQTIFSKSSVQTVLIQGDRGTHKSHLARNLCLHLQNNFNNFNFKIDNIVFNNDDLYERISNYIIKNKHNILKDNLKNYTAFIRDESEESFGFGSDAGLTRLTKLIELIRICKIFLFIISPTQELKFEDSIEHKFSIMPIAYDKHEKEFFCLLKEYNDLDFIGYIIIKDIEKHNSKLFLEYDKLKRTDLLLSAEMKKKGLDYFNFIYQLHKDFNILNLNYKIVNKTDIKLHLLSKNDMFLYINKLGFQLTIQEQEILFSQYRLLMSNEEEINFFKNYCKQKKLKFKQNNNYKEIENEIE